MDARRVLELLDGEAHVEIVSERQELLRFARSTTTYQHSEERVTARVRLVRDGRSAWGTLTSPDEESVRALRRRLEAVLEHLPPGTAELAVDRDPPSGAAETSFAATAEAGAAERAVLVARVAAALPAGAELGGSALDVVAEHAVVSSTGIDRRETRTRSALQLVAAADGRSSFAKLVHRDRDALLAGLPAALERLRGGLEPLPSCPPAVGRHRAVLSPQALAGVLAPFGYSVFDGRAVAAGASAASAGAARASPEVSLVDDALDPAGLPASFDSEGVGKRRVALVDEGVPVGAVHDTASARETGTSSTGHAVPPAWRFGSGPSVSHLVVAPGAATDEELLAACGTGLYLQRVDYLRVVHPKTTLATGSSRDGTLWLEDGRVVGRVPQFRFTVELADVLRSVELLGERRERSELVFLESVVAPGAVVSAFPVDALTGT